MLPINDYKSRKMFNLQLKNVWPKPIVKTSYKVLVEMSPKQISVGNLEKATKVYGMPDVLRLHMTPLLS